MAPALECQLEALHMALALEWRTPSQEGVPGNHFETVGFKVMCTAYGTRARMAYAFPRRGRR